MIGTKPWNILLRVRVYYYFYLENYKNYLPYRYYIFDTFILFMFIMQIKVFYSYFDEEETRTVVSIHFSETFVPSH